MNDFLKLVLLVLGGLIGLALVVILTAWPIQILWNWLMPELFGFKVITFGQALGISMLSALLFKSSSTGSSK